MSTVEEAELAVEKLNAYQNNGRTLTVNKAAPRPERTPRTFAPAFRMYVGNLPWQVDAARLDQVFIEHGKVVDARVVFDRETQRSRGFGFVTMSNETELIDDIAALDGQVDISLQRLYIFQRQLLVRVERFPGFFVNEF